MGDMQIQVPIKRGHDFLLKIFKTFFQLLSKYELWVLFLINKQYSLSI